MQQNIKLKNAVSAIHKRSHAALKYLPAMNAHWKTVKEIGSIGSSVSTASVNALMEIVKEIPVYQATLQAGFADELEAATIAAAVTSASTILKAPPSADADADHELLDITLKLLKGVADHCSHDEDAAATKRKLQEKKNALKSQAQMGIIEAAMDLFKLNDMKTYKGIMDALAKMKPCEASEPVGNKASMIWISLLCQPKFKDFMGEHLHEDIDFMKALVPFMPETSRSGAMAVQNALKPTLTMVTTYLSLSDLGADTEQQAKNEDAPSKLDKLDKELARARHFLQLARSPEYSDWCKGAQAMVQTAADATKSVATVICKSKLSELEKASAKIAVGTLCEQHDKLKKYYGDGSTKLVLGEQTCSGEGQHRDVELAGDD